MFVGTDLTAKFSVAQIVDTAVRRTAKEFLLYMFEAVLSQIQTNLTDNGIQFAEQRRNQNIACSRQTRFDWICEANGLDHRLTKPNHPCTNSQVERMNRTIKEATVRRYNYDSYDLLRTSVADFLAACNFGRRRKILNGLMSYEYIRKSGHPSWSDSLQTPSKKLLGPKKSPACRYLRPPRCFFHHAQTFYLSY